MKERFCVLTQHRFSEAPLLFSPPPPPQAWSALRASCARGYATTPSLRDYDAVTIAQTKPQRGAVVVNPMRESIGDATKHGENSKSIYRASEKRCCGL